MRIGVGTAAIFLAFAATTTALSGPVLIATEGTTGTGYGFRVGEQCVILTADHVIAPGGIAGDPTISDDRVSIATSASAWFRSPEIDIARTSLPVRDMPSCIETFVSPEWTEGFDFRNNSGAMLLGRVARSSTRQIPMRVTGSEGNDFLLTEMRKGTVTAGYSGSMLFLNNKPFAIARQINLKDGTVVATRLLAATRQWPTAFRADGFRTRIGLTPIFQQRRQRDDLFPFAMKALQDKPNIQLVGGSDGGNACIVRIEVAGVNYTTSPNPQYEQYRKNNCGSTRVNLLGVLTCPAQAPARTIYNYKIDYVLQAQMPGGAVRVATPAFDMVSVDRGLNRAQMETALFQETVGRAVDQAMQEGACR